MNDLPSTLPQEFTKDLPYEIDQLRGTYERLIVGSSKDGVIQNALIESFATHARNLVEMFLGKRNSMDPTRFTEPQYSPDRVSLQVLYSEICGQISHLQEGARAKNDSDKFNATAPRTIGLLETEIKHFTECLKPGCVFKCETQPVKVAEDALPSVSATNAVFSITAPANPPAAAAAAELPRRDSLRHRWGTEAAEGQAEIGPGPVAPASPVRFSGEGYWPRTRPVWRPDAE